MTLSGPHLELIDSTECAEVRIVREAGFPLAERGNDTGGRKPQTIITA